jgi:phage terminase large subunit-like protein
MATRTTASPDDAGRDYIADGIQYARDVVAGKIPNCKWVRLAAKRMLDDLAKYGQWTPYRFDPEDDGYDPQAAKRIARTRPKGEYYFDPVAAAKPCAFGELLPHVKGKWATRRRGRRELIVLQPWQCFILINLFGWKRTANNLRRFWRAYIKIPRKNGKSVLAAVIGLYMFCMDGETGAEVYSGATSEKQAWEVFRPAREMFKAEETEDLRDLVGGEVWAKALITADLSRFEPIIGKPGDGASPSCSIADEFHEHDTPDQVNTMETGMGAREQPLSLKITTAGVNLAGPCYDTETDAQKVLQGLMEDDQLFAIMYGIDLPEGEDDADKKGDDWTDPAILAKANPNLNVSVFEDFLRAQQKQAAQNPLHQNTFKTKHLNVWCAAKVAWMSMPIWKTRADTKRKLEHFRGQECVFGLDLASKDDIACFGKLFWRDIETLVPVEVKPHLLGVNVTDDAVRALATKVRMEPKMLRHYWLFNRYYVPEDALYDADNPNRFKYQQWHQQGHLIVTPGAEIDFDMIGADVRADKDLYQCRELVYDPWRATQLAHQCAKEGAEVVELRQIVQHLSQPMKELASAVRGGRFNHDNNPVTNWMFSNVVALKDGKDNIYPQKEKKHSPAKIDGATTAIMMMNRAMVVTDEGTIDDWLKGGAVVVKAGGR